MKTRSQKFKKTGNVVRMVRLFLGFSFVRPARAALPYAQRHIGPILERIGCLRMTDLISESTAGELIGHRLVCHVSARK